MILAAAFVTFVPYIFYYNSEKIWLMSVYICWSFHKTIVTGIHFFRPLCNAQQCVAVYLMKSLCCMTVVACVWLFFAIKLQMTSVTMRLICLFQDLIYFMISVQ